MTTAIAIFVKTPSLSPVKTRLAKTIGKDKALEFYHLSLKATQETATQIDADIFWAVGEQEGLNDPLWAGFKTIYTGEGGLGHRQHHIYSTLLNSHDNVILLGADTPQISDHIINQAITELNHHDFVIGNAHDGGYYLFGGKKPLPKEIWTSVKYSQPTTRKELISKLPQEPKTLPPLTDVDTQENLKQICLEMPLKHTQSQQNIIKWVTNLPQCSNIT